jgi:hypothetical protein
MQNHWLFKECGWLFDISAALKKFYTVCYVGMLVVLVVIHLQGVKLLRFLPKTSPVSSRWRRVSDSSLMSDYSCVAVSL